MHTYDDVQKQRVAELSQAIDIGMAQLHQKQVVDGQTSRKKMKLKVDAIANGKA